MVGWFALIKIFPLHALGYLFIISHEIKENKIGFNNASVTIQEKSENETNLYDRLIEEKDKVIALQAKYIAELEEKLANK